MGGGKKCRWVGNILQLSAEKLNDSKVKDMTKVLARLARDLVASVQHWNSQCFERGRVIIIKMDGIERYGEDGDLLQSDRH